MHISNNFKTLVFLAIICILPRIIIVGIALTNNNNDPSVFIEEDSVRYCYLANAINDNGLDKLLQESKIWDAPLYPIILSCILKLPKANEIFAVSINIIFFSLAVFIVYLIGKMLFTATVGILASILFSFYPSTFIYSLYPMPEPPFLLVFLASIYFLICYLKKPQTINLIFSIILIGASTLLKEVTILFPAVILIIIIHRFRNDKKIITKSLFVMVIIYTMVLSPIITINMQQKKSYLISEKLSIYSNFLEKTLAKAIGKPKTILKYCKPKKAFLYGCGTIGMTKVMGYNTSELNKSKKDPIIFLKALKKLSWSLFLFQIFGWVIIVFIQLSSLVFFLYLVIKKDFTKILLFFLPILYFAIAYLHHDHTRYFLPIVPWLTILSAAGINYIRTLIPQLNRKSNVRTK